MILDSLSPLELGMPAKFSAYRPVQKEIVEYGLGGPLGAENAHAVDATTGENGESAMRRFVCIGAPAGSGKSLAAHTIGRLSGRKYVVLTATRTLEDQQVTDAFPVVNVRGRANYECRGASSICNCEEGAEEEGCPLADTRRCTYGERVWRARESGAILTNYQYWFNSRGRNGAALESKNGGSSGGGGGEGRRIGLLIADEAHLCANELARHLGCWFGNDDLHKHANEEIRQVVRDTHGADWGRVDMHWTAALNIAYFSVLSAMEEIGARYATDQAAMRGSAVYRKLAKMGDGLGRIVNLGGDGNWIWRLTKSGIAFDCVWPGRYAERYLWSHIERVVLMSATLRPKAMQMLGIPSSAYWFKEWPRVFLPQLSPVYWIPTGRMGMKAGEEGKEKSVAFFDNQLMPEWGHLKGIVHTPSYKLAEYYQARSKYGRAIVVNEQGSGPEGANRAANLFRASKPPCVLVSPTFSTGWDFPIGTDEVCGWQWIPKLPFADLTDPVVQARRESDPEWYDYECMQKLVQACGRRSRTETDRATTFITDDAVKGFRYYSRAHAPRWFRVMDATGGRVPRAPR